MVVTAAKAAGDPGQSCMLHRMGRRAILVVAALCLLAGCGEPSASSSVTVASNASTAPTTYTQADVDAAHAYFGAHPSQPDGAWHNAIVLSSTITPNQKHWYGVLVLETGEVRSYDDETDDDAEMALLVGHGDLIRFKEQAYGRGYSVEGAFSTYVTQKGILDRHG